MYDNDCSGTLICGSNWGTGEKSNSDCIEKLLPGDQEDGRFLSENSYGCCWPPDIF